MRALIVALTVMILVTLSQAGAAGAAGAETIVVVVNKSNSVNALSRDDLRPIFQTTKLQWPDGSHIAAYDLPDGDSVRNGFDAAVLGLDPDRVARYWVDRKIRGGERPPPKVGTASAMLHAIAANKGGIGYVPAAEVTDSVKIVARIRGGEVVAP